MHVGWGTHLYAIMSIAITGKYMNVGWGTIHFVFVKYVFVSTTKHLSLYVINKLGDKCVFYSFYTPVYV